MYIQIHEITLKIKRIHYIVARQVLAETAKKLFLVSLSFYENHKEKHLHLTRPTISVDNLIYHLIYMFQFGERLD